MRIILSCSRKFIGLQRWKWDWEPWCVVGWSSSTVVRLADWHAACHYIHHTGHSAFVVLLGEVEQVSQSVRRIQRKASGVRVRAKCAPELRPSACASPGWCQLLLQCAPLGANKLIDAGNVKRHGAAAVLTVSHQDAAPLLMGSRHAVQSWHWQQAAVSPDIPPRHTQPPTFPLQIISGPTSTDSNP